MSLNSYKKDDAIRIITSAAKDYRDILEGMNYIFIYRNRVDGSMRFFETLFLPKNFQHLTGIEYYIDGEKVREPVRFYNECLDARISEGNIQFRNDGTTPLKLAALPRVVNFISSSKMTGIYNGIRPKLAVDRMAGTTNFCLGFTKDGGYYFPSSCLLEDVRDLTEKPSQVLAIMSKGTSESIYQKIRYVAKGLPFDKLDLPEGLVEIIDRSGFIAK